MSRWKSCIHPMLGKNHTKESMEKIRASGTLFKKGQTPWNKGMNGLKIGTRKGDKFSDLHKEKLSLAKREFFKNGGKPWNFKGNKEWENESIRHSLEYTIWRQEVCKRDRWTCRLCGSKKSIIAHHIKLFSKFPELRFSIENGLTLCRPCHCKIHKPSVKIL